ncbi:MAG: succinyl-diaminopimelate desuccinylase [Burkholderiaceae bacterium]|nr:succinyl-diaminopimelate desuccinylase [Burkholderiaceae bacterium]
MSATFQLLCQLIARPSVTPEDAGCQALIAQRLAPFGFRAETIARNGTTNLWLRRGTQRPLVVLAGHTDVVPPGPREAWHSDPFAPTVRDGRLYGRGAADMKSSLAAFVVAVEEFVRRQPAHRGSIALLLTSDEEGPATDGTVAVVEALRARGEAIDYALVGEPTSVDRLGDTIKNGRRGSLSGRLTVRGVQGHVAYPQLARNPVHELAPALAQLVAETWDQGDAYFPPTTFQVSNIHAGTGAGNVIPGVCVVDFNLRFAPASPAPRLRARVEDILRAHRLDYELRWTLGAEPFLTPPGALVEAVRRAIEATTGVVPTLSTTGGTSDGRFLATICPQVVEFGPPNASIHQVNEHIALADLEPLKDVYRRTLESLLAPASA